jgi:hypothetical protein
MAVHRHFSVPQARHSLSGLNREHSLTDAIKMREHSRRHKDAISFGTRALWVRSKCSDCSELGATCSSFIEAVVP